MLSIALCVCLLVLLQVAALAAAGYYVVVPDMPGYGQSDKPSDVSSYSLKHVCSVLCNVLDALGVQAACVVGHDWGAATAWALALQHPQRVSRLVVLSVGHPGGGRTAHAMRKTCNGRCCSTLSNALDCYVANLTNPLCFKQQHVRIACCSSLATACSARGAYVRSLSIIRLLLMLCMLLPVLPAVVAARSGCVGGAQAARALVVHAVLHTAWR